MDWIQKTLIITGIVTIVIYILNEKAEQKYFHPPILFAAAGLVALSIALLSEGMEIHEDWGGFLVNISTEIIGIVITILYVNYLYERRDKESEEKRLKDRLIREMSSLDNADALKAVGELRANGWLEDGSLKGKVFGNANLTNALLVSASLEETWFRGAIFKKAILSEAYLRGAKLIDADFTHADLIGADLYMSQMHNAKIKDTNLQKANLTQSDLTDEQLTNAFSLKDTTMPNGTKYDGRYRLYADLEAFENRWGKNRSPEEWATFYGVSVEQYLAGQKWANENPQYSSRIHLG